MSSSHIHLKWYVIIKLIYFNQSCMLLFLIVLSLELLPLPCMITVAPWVSRTVCCELPSKKQVPDNIIFTNVQKKPLMYDCLRPYTQRFTGITNVKSE